MSSGEVGTLFDAVLADTRVMRCVVMAESGRAEIRVHFVDDRALTFADATFEGAVSKAAQFLEILPA